MVLATTECLECGLPAFDGALDLRVNLHVLQSVELRELDATTAATLGYCGRDDHANEVVAQSLLLLWGSTSD
jgi:hypothetical protein